MSKFENVYRHEITEDQCKQAFQEIESDLEENILAHVVVPWTQTFRETESLSASHTRSLGVHSADLLHVGFALALNAIEFLTFDERAGITRKSSRFEGKALILRTNSSDKEEITR